MIRFFCLTSFNIHVYHIIMSQTSHIMQTKPKELGYISGGFCLCVGVFLGGGGYACRIQVVLIDRHQLNYYVTYGQFLEIHISVKDVLLKLMNRKRIKSKFSTLKHYHSLVEKKNHRAQTDFLRILTMLKFDIFKTI